MKLIIFFTQVLAGNGNFGISTLAYPLSISQTLRAGFSMGVASKFFEKNNDVGQSFQKGFHRVSI